MASSFGTKRGLEFKVKPAGSAYSGHYHALIRDCLHEGRWLPPAGLNPYQTLDMDKSGAAGEGNDLEESRQGDASDCLRAETGKGEGRSQMGPKELLLDIFRGAPKHGELGQPCIPMLELRNATRSRLDGRRWDKVFSVRLDKYLKERPELFMLQCTEEGPTEVLLLQTEEGGTDDAADPPNTSAEGEKDVALSNCREANKDERLRLSLPGIGEDGSGDGVGGSGVGKGSKAKVAPPGTVDALASEKHGRWFSFDDRKVTPISIRDIEKPFSGAETAYLLIYRSRSLDQEVPSLVTPAEIAAAISKACVGKDKGMAAASAESQGGGRDLPGGLHMTSVPPSYWMDKVDSENESLKTVKDTKEAGLHGMKLRVLVLSVLLVRFLDPSHLPFPALTLPPLAYSLPAQLPEELRLPLVLDLDDRQTVDDLKREAVKRLGKFCREMGIPDLARVRLSELTHHGPGLFLSQHLSDQPEHPPSPPSSSSSSRRGGDRRRSGQGRGRNHDPDRDGNSRGKGAETAAASALVLGDLEWGVPEEPCVLMWDGEGIGGVELPDPRPENRPIGLVVSVLRASEDAGEAGWINSVLQQAGTFGPVPARDGSRVETCQTWRDVYARAGVTAAEVVDLVSERGPAEVSASTMCISLLRASSSSSASVGRDDASEFHGSGRRRTGGSGSVGGGVQMEAVQIAGPSGVFQEWKALTSKQSGAGGKHGTVGAESSGLDLSEGSELLVEEQGAVSKLITSNFSSLAEMEAARRNRLVAVNVEVDDSLLEILTRHHLPLAHDVAVALHEGRQVTLHLECDAHATSIPHLKARCLLDLVPSLKEDLIPSSALEALLPPAPPASAAAGTAGATSGGRRDELALVGLIKTVRLEHKKSGNALDESSTGASLFAARIADGASLLLEWGAPPATGKALVKFYVRVGNSTGTARDPARGGTTYGPLDVIADLKEPVSSLKARMIEKAAEMSYIVQDGQERRIRVEALMGDSNTLIEELKDFDTAAPSNRNDAKGKAKSGDTPAGPSSAAVDEEEGIKAEGEGDAETSGASGKSKKKRKKKKGGGAGKAPAVEKDGALVESNSNGAAAVAAAADEAIMVEGGASSPLFQERLVEESGILGGQEVYLEDGRVPKPRELEITVLAYAPHFLGLAAAAASEKLKLKKASASAIGVGVGGGADKANGAASGRAAVTTGDGVSGMVPTGLSTRAVWPDEEERRKKADVEKHLADPVRLLSLQRQLSMRTLGHFHIDERQSLTELRSILRGFLSDGLNKATKASMAEALRAAEEAEATRAARAAEAASKTAARGDADANADVMPEDEIDGILNMMKAKTSKSRKKRNSHGRGGAGGVSGTTSGKSTSRSNPTKPPPPLPAADPGNAEGRGGLVGAPNGGRSAGADTMETGNAVASAAAEEVQKARGGDGDADAGGGGVWRDRAGVKEVKTEVADSDDEISLPEGVPGFEGLEDAMLVRELRKDRLPGKIIRAGDDGSGNTTGGIFVGKPISELHLSSSVALVICLRPRLPQTPLAVEVKMSRREKLASELVENGQANVTKALGGSADQGEEETRELTLEEQQKQQLGEAQANLSVLETNLTDLLKKRELDLEALKAGNGNLNQAKKIAKLREQHESIRAWEKDLKTRKDHIDTTNLREEKPLEKEVKAMKKAVDKLRNRVKRMEQDQDQDKGKAASASAAIDSSSVFTRVKGVIFSSAKMLGYEPVQLRSEQEKEKDKEKGNTGGGGSSSSRKDTDWGIPATGSTSAAKKPKGGGGKGAGKKPGPPSHPPASASSTPADAEAAAAGNGDAAISSTGASPETTAADLQRARDDEIERRRTDPSTDLHLWTFWRKNPLGDGGTLPVDDPEWPGPLKEVIVEDTSQPTLDNLHEALGKAYGIPSSRVWAIKHNWGKHQWVRLTREMGFKKQGNKKSKKSRRLVTNLRENPYSLKDGDVIGVVDRLEDESGLADLTRADDEAYRDQEKGHLKVKVKKDRRNRKKNKQASKRPAPEIGLTLGDWDDGGDDEDSDESEDSEGDDLSDMMHF
ncbi:unnamed protein product [Scytosiphon promiscuus]